MHAGKVGAGIVVARPGGVGLGLGLRCGGAGREGHVVAGDKVLDGKAAFGVGLAGTAWACSSKTPLPAGRLHPNGQARERLAGLFIHKLAGDFAGAREIKGDFAHGVILIEHQGGARSHRPGGELPDDGLRLAVAGLLQLEAVLSKLVELDAEGAVRIGLHLLERLGSGGPHDDRLVGKAFGQGEERDFDVGDGLVDARFEDRALDFGPDFLRR